MFITYYNHPYYLDHMTRLGYVKDVDWVEFLIDIPGPEDKLTQRLDQMQELEVHEEFSEGILTTMKSVSL